MSFREVNNLRKNGDLEAALKMAKEDLDKEQSEWSYSALFWVLRDLCKTKLEQNIQNEALEYFNRMSEIFSEMEDVEGYASRAVETLKKNFTKNNDKIEHFSALSKNGKEDEAYKGFIELKDQSQIPDNLHEDCGWIIFRYLKKYYASIGSLEARKALHNYLQLNNKRPSMLHSQILNLAMNVSENYTDFKFLPFLQLWGVDNFSDDDYTSSYYENKQIDPLIERIIRRCFNIGYSLNEVVTAFRDKSKHDNPTVGCITWLNTLRDNATIVMNNYAKNSFFELSKLYRENNNPAFFAQSVAYFDAINSADIKSEFHSRILSLYLYQIPEGQDREVISAVDKWGVQNFTQDDWKREKNQNDSTKEYPSLVEKVVKRYFAALKAVGLHTACDKFISLLKQSVEKYKDEQTERNLALVYAATNQKDKALIIYRKLLLSLDRFYVWKELADVADEDELKISALCKAILSEPKDDFLGEVHLSLAKLLNKKWLYEQAKCELNKYKETYEKNKWRLKSEYSILLNEIPSDTQSVNNNQEFYNSHLEAAEEFVYSDINWETMFITQLYTQKNDDGKEIKKAKLVSVKGNEMPIKQKQLQPPDCRFVGACFDVKIYQEKIVLIKPSKKQIGDLLETVIGYVDYYNQDKNVYHIIDNNKKQYLLNTTNKLREGIFCQFYAVPQPPIKKEIRRINRFENHNRIKVEDKKTTEKPPLALYAGDIDQEQVINSLPEKYALIDNVNKEKKIYQCISTDGIGVAIPFSQIESNRQKGDFIKIKFVDKIKKQSDKEIIRKVVCVNSAEATEAKDKFALKVAVVDGVNDSKQLFHCVFGTNMDIIIKYSDTSLRPNIGDYVLIRYAFHKESTKTFRKMLDISMSEQGKTILRKTITDKIRTNINNKGQRFGFVGDYYVGENFLSDIENGDKVKIDVVYDGAKWRTYKLEKV